MTTSPDGRAPGSTPAPARPERTDPPRGDRVNTDRATAAATPRPGEARAPAAARTTAPGESNVTHATASATDAATLVRPSAAAPASGAAAATSPAPTPTTIDSGHAGPTDTIEPGANGDAPDTFDQASIDALFGVESAPRPTRRTGLRALIEADVANHERLPMLEVVCERMVRTLGTSMRNLTADSLDVRAERVSTMRFAEFMDHLPLPAMIGVFLAKQWGNYGLITVDSSLVYAVVDSLLGGRRAPNTMRIDGRAFTAIETHLVGRMMQQTLDDFAQSFEAIEPVDFALERVEVTPRFAAIAAPTNLTAVASFRIDMEGRGGRFHLVLPHATIEPVREKLIERFVGEKMGRNTMWESHIAEELLHTEVQVDAVLGERELRIEDYLALSEGRTITLDRAPDDGVALECRGVPLATGTIGTHSSLAAIRLSTPIGQVAS
ncbi:flagellar motor switch protein FliM [Sphingomonas sp. BK069]|uniref:flagellar motor switch protein FliM n=1 Tax=Sphingomonas sp. BK069 TaxID=2586979 RepID=UPI001611D023|nr:flagellar motor switch protein FliM [Sphingomonas sp. BK069]MBB3346285.1 flagellar motor switch protein FliM [Sphingomonas sp. BK069]